MTHPSHQTNGASLEDCHTNFFALVSDRRRLCRRGRAATATRGARSRPSFAGEPRPRRRRRRHRARSLRERHDRSGNGTTGPLSRSAAGIVKRDDTSCRGTTTTRAATARARHPLDVAPYVNLYSRPVLAVVDVDVDIVAVVGRAAVVYCLTTSLPPLPRSFSLPCARVRARTRVYVRLSEISSLLCRSQCHA